MPTLHDVEPGCKDADALVKELAHSGWSMFVAGDLEKAMARYEKYGNRKLDEDEDEDEDEDDEDFDPEKEWI